MSREHFPPDSPELSPPIGWACGALDGDVAEAFSALERGMHVALIATFGLRDCQPSQQVAEVIDHPDLRDFDHIPVRADNGSIIGLFDRGQDHPRDRTVRDVIRPLHESMLIAADTPLISFVEAADREPCRLVLRGLSIDGIVTLSDLQKLAVRMVLFAYITNFELLLTQWLRRNFAPATWLGALDQQDRDTIDRRWQRLEEENLAIDQVTATDLRHKNTAAHRLGLFTGIEDVGTMLPDINNLRNSIAHGHEFAQTREAAAVIPRRVRGLRRLTDTAREALGYRSRDR